MKLSMAIYNAATTSCPLRDPAAIRARRAIRDLLGLGLGAITRGDTRGIGVNLQTPCGEVFAFARRYSEYLRPRLIRVATTGQCPKVEVTFTPREVHKVAPWIVYVMVLPPEAELPDQGNLFDGAPGENLWTIKASQAARERRKRGLLW